MKQGDQFGRWTVIGEPPSTARARVLCRCECGTEREINADNLRRRISASCGCRRAEANRRRQTPAPERFWEKVNKAGPIPEHRPDLGACWVWSSASLDEKGYGRFWDGERHVKAHRYSFELAFGSMSDGLEPDHLCRNRACVNPGHLEAVTHRENSQRAAYAKGTCSQGHPLPPPGPNGRRVCRPCANERNRKYKQRKEARAMYDAITGGRNG